MTTAAKTKVAAKKIEQAVAASQETIESAVKVGQQAAQKVAAAGQETIESAVKVGQEAAQKVVAAGQETIESAVKVGQEAAQKVVAAGQETIDTAVKAGQEAAQKAQAVAEKAQAAALKSYEDAQVSTKDGIDAVIKSSEILTSGLQEITQAVVSLTQTSIEEGVSVSKQILAAKSIREWADLQSTLSKAQVDRLVAETTRLSDLSLKLIEDAFAPITAQVNAGIDRMVKRAA
ncbi:phasin family protein [Magnetospirillum moscoviense]|uniref:Phasin domain-containing protein n=1 Tax=Magnetospirillum moscoviense TaxID=1437059 RepID=A0A178MG29_9PROT|nr:phasin family protein [Magnetospirillum moscoviense]MBF0324050.1 phasin family protein [Alphaproteobacteria bacterium]OAN47048.1 hypothetical protein A6A05_15940 [Magnetospirillum moscoviense]